VATVQVIYHDEPDGWWAESPDVDGFGAAGESLEEVRRLAAEGIPFYLETADVELDERFPTTVVSSHVTGFTENSDWGTHAAAPSKVHATWPIAA
jgi:predicted RNase H-like HicB family nuclease